MTAANRPEPGSPIVFRWRKWDGSPHWEHDALYLGSDEWGDWVGQPAGSRSARPGRALAAPQPNVTLMPPTGDYAFTRNAPPHHTHTYIDLAWDVRWEGGTPVGVDMDLDVVDHTERGLWIDDRDEWDEHRVQFGYPAEVQAHLEQLAVELERQVAASAPPFDDATAQRWLDLLARLRPEAPA